MKKAVLTCLLISVCCFGHAAPLGDDALAMISISADEASEGEQAGVLNFSGNFLMRSKEWQLTSEKATVHGSPNKPDRVVLEGTPAQFFIKRDEASNRDQIKATAQLLEYQRDKNILLLSGGATLTLQEEVIRSTHIEYDIETNRYKAGGSNGVIIEVPTGY